MLSLHYGTERKVYIKIKVTLNVMVPIFNNKTIIYCFFHHHTQYARKFNISSLSAHLSVSYGTEIKIK